MLFHIFILAILLVYTLFIFSFVFGFGKVADFQLAGLKNKTKFSVVVVYRNEAENLPQLLDSVLNLNYPLDLFEIILVNDFSEDSSVQICKAYQNNFPSRNFKLVNAEVSKTPKKAAILKALESAQFEFIAITDADCVLPPGWLKNFDELIQKKSPVLIAGPVGFNPVLRKNWFQQFEEIDFLSLQGATIGSFGLKKAFMCNAANLCYNKQAYLEIQNDRADDGIASGDDVFLLQSFQKKGRKVEFLKAATAIVKTNFQSKFSTLFQQRVRWAAKTSNYPDFFGKITAVFVFLMNLSLLMLPVMALLQIVSWRFAITVFLSKFLVDWILLYRTANFFSRMNALRSYFWSSLLYPVFSVAVVVQTFFGSYEWKGRKFQK